MNRLEQAECIAFMDWAHLVAYDGEPLSNRIFHIPNERDKPGVNIAKLIKMGLQPGFHDYGILIPARHHHGLYIEAKSKSKRARTSVDQLTWRDRLIRYGYHAEICAGFEQMVDAVRRYVRQAPGVFVDRTRLCA